jgi:hypothetical protein
MGRSYKEIAADTAELVEYKQEQYGDSFGKSGEILRILYPTGIMPEQYDNLLTLVRMWDKMFRMVFGNDDENSFADIMGYALLAVKRREDLE